MNMHWMKRGLSLLLALLLLVGNIPATAFATEEIAEEAVTETVAATAAPTEAETEPAKETVAPTVAATESVQETVAPTKAVTEPATEPVQETAAPTEAATEPATEPVEETIAPTLPAVPEEPIAPTEVAEGEDIPALVKTEYQFTVSDLDLPTDAELYTAYAEHVLYGTQIQTFGTAAGERLTGDEKLLYDAMVPLIKEIASGERASTVIGVGQTVTSGGVTYEPDVEMTFTGEPLTDEGSTRVFDALLSDLPYEMYWFDKTAGWDSVVFTMSGNLYYLQLSFAVADNYQGTNEYTADTAKTGVAAAAARRADSIVAKYAASSDYEKLVGYRDEICALVSYNTDAANDSNFSEDNDPWQLIHVFDGDDSTNVVCEGYAKAFMYLCDLSDFAGDVSCYTVSGQMNGGNHMWNVVTLEGANYLVDVTNSDVGTIGQAGGLFLAGGTGSASSTYNVMGIYFAYNIRTKDFWGTGEDSILILASENYTPQTDGGEEEDENLIASGTCGENLTWSLNNEGKLTISGTGEMTSSPWTDAYFESIKSIVIEEGVTSIGEYAFNGCANLANVTIGKGVASIGNSAFSYCSSLTSITIPAGVTSIGNYTFTGCSSMTSVSIPDTVKSIGSNAFHNCSSLTSITIPAGVTSIGESAFHNCNKVKSVVIPNGVTSIPSFVFSACESLETIVLPAGLTDIGNNAFSGCRGLTSLTIPDSVTTIGDSAFDVCQNLTNIDIPASVTSIGRGAFLNCQKLEGIWVDAANTTYCSDASGVLYTKDMKTLIVAHPAIEYNYEVAGSVTTIEDYAFANSFLRSIVIPASVTSIGSYVFANGSAMECITFEGDAPEMESDAFRWVTTTAYYPSNNETWTESVRQNYGGTITWVPILQGSCGENLTWKLDPEGTLTISGTGAMTDFRETAETAAPWYAHRESITSVVIEAGATSIGNNAFRDCRNITSIDIPDGVTKIGVWAFVVCQSLERIEIPASVTTIREGAFAVCANLEEIRVSDGNSVYCNDASGALYTKDMKTLVHVPNISGRYEIPVGVTRIAAHAFSGCTNLTSIHIPDSVTHIEFAAFFECSSLERIEIPDSVISLERNAFNHCTNLMNVKIGSGVTDMEQYMFYNCTSLEKITIPATVNAIGQGAFEGCTNLREIWFDGDAPEFYAYEGENNAFQDIRAIAYYFEYNPTWTASKMQDYGGDIAWVSYVPRDTIASGLCGERVAWTLYLDGTLTIGGEGPMYNYEHGDQPWAAYKKSIKSVEIKSGVTFAGWNAFRECTNLATVTLGSGMKSIGGYAFAGCKALTEIRIPEGVTSIAMGAFTDCSGLKIAVLPSTVTDIGMGTFQLCTNLEHVNIPAGVEVISNGTFMQCSSLKKIKLPDSVKTIEMRAFNGCVALTGIKIPAGVTAIGEAAFAGCSTLTGITFEGDAPAIESDAFGDVKAIVYYPAGNPTWTADKMQNYGGKITWKALPGGTCGDNVNWMLEADGTLIICGAGYMEGYWEDAPAPWYDVRNSIKTVVIKDGVETIGSNAFRECINLTSVTIGDDVNSIDGSAFWNCQRLQTVYIPASVGYIWERPFAFCNNLDGIWVDPKNQEYCNDAFGVLYTKNMESLIQAPGKLSGNYVIPDTVEHVGSYAFAGCSQLTDIQISSKVSSLEGTFSGCSSLTSIAIPDSIGYIGWETFSGCTNLKKITFKGDLPYIEGDEGQPANFLKDVTATVYYPSDNTTWTSDVMQNYGGKITWKPIPRGTCGENVTWMLDNEGTLTISGTGDMDGYGNDVVSPWWNDYREEIKSVIIRDGVTSVGDCAFSRCENLTDVTIGKDVTNIGRSAFAQCWKLENITLPEGLTSIELNAFYGCAFIGIDLPESLTTIGFSAFGGTRLTSVEIPAGVTSIDRYAFSQCNDLNGIWVSADNETYCNDAYGAVYTKDGKTLVAVPGGMTGTYKVPAGVTRILEGAFAGCRKLTSVEIPSSITEIEDGTFSWCSGIKSIVIPGSVTSIGDEAFFQCNMESIVIPASVKSIGDYAFHECFSLKTVTFEGDAPTMESDTFTQRTVTAYYPAGNPTWTSDVMQNYGGTITWLPYGETVASGTCGENLTWSLNNKGTLTISGTGAMTDYNPGVANTPWSDRGYNQEIKSVVIKDGVTSIGDGAFLGCLDLISVTIGKDVTSIGTAAFGLCRQLQSVYIPAAVTSIGASPFAFCNSLDGIWVDTANSAFSSDASGVLYTKDIKRLVQAPGKLSGNYVIPDTVTEMDDYAFSGCTKLTGIQIPDGITAIEGTFNECSSLTDVSLPNSLTRIGVETFFRCTALQSIHIPASVDTIEWYAFGRCTNLKKITFEGDAPRIVEVENDVQPNTFMGVTATAYYPGGNPTWTSDVMQNYGGKITWKPIPRGTCGENVTWMLDDEGTLTISGTGYMDGYWNDGVAPWYNDYRKEIKTVVIKDGVTSVGGQAFFQCDNLTTVIFGKDVTSIGNGAFAQCFKLENFTLPEGLVSIGMNAFVYCNATSIVFPESLTTIGEDAFSGCSRLTKVEIPAGLTSIDEGPFSGDTNLEGIWVSKENPAYCNDASGVLYSKDMTKLIQAPGKLSGEYRIPAGVTRIADSAFQQCEKLTRVIIPDGVTSIGWAAFGNCRALESVIIPDSVTTIEYAAFDRCVNLTSVKIPAGVTDIGDVAFGQCSNLKGIWVSNSNTAYCSDVYGVLYTKDMTELVQAPGAISGSYEIPGSVTVIHHCAFAGCEKLSSVAIPDSVETIDWSAFAYCRSLTSIVIPDGVTSLGDTTFWACESLKSIAIPASVTSISQSAFAWCNNLEDIYYGGTAAQWTALDESVPDVEYMHYSCTNPEQHWKTVRVDVTFTGNGYSYEYCSCGYERNSVFTGNALGLPKPVVQVISDPVTGGATLRWEHDGEADRYAVYRATSKSGKYALLADVPSTALMVSVGAGKTYYYKVKAVCDANSSLNSGYSSVVKVTGKCAQPQITVKADVASGKPVIKWSKISGAAKYYVYRVDDATGALTSIGSTTKTSFTDSKAVVGTTYSYQVRANASKSAYNSANSETKSCLTRCAQPVVTVKINADTGKPVLSWQTISGATSYEILRAESVDGTFKRLAVLNDLRFEDGTAAPDKDYWYKVNAVVSRAELNSADGTAKMVRATLEKPVVTFAIDDVTGKPILTWNEVPGAVEYKIYRSTSSTKSYKAIATTTDTEYLATTASVGKGYYYKVIAIGETGKSVYSSYKKLTAKCAQPVITVEANETSGKPVITWSKISGAKKYYVYRVDEYGVRTSIGSTTKTYFTDSKAVLGTTYTYQVRANGSKSAYNSIYSEIKSCLTVLAQPVVTAKNDTATGKPILTWKAITGAVGYAIYRAENDGAFKFVTAQTTLTYLDEDVVVDGKYSYKVKAIAESTALNSADSASKTITAACAQPVASIALNGKKPMVSWNSVEGATKYYVYRSTKKSSGYKKVATVEEESYTDAKAKKGTTYYYKVVAVSENATSAQSAYVKIKSK